MPPGPDDTSSKPVAPASPTEDAEPRVRDLIARGESPAVTDPQTIAQLAAWFGLPSFADVEEDQARAAAEAAEPSRVEQIQQRRKEALAQIDPALLAHVTRHATRAERMARIETPPRPWDGDARLTTFDPSQVPPELTEDDWREVEIPNELSKDLKTSTPQAFLRDLHRPEKDFYVRLQPPWDDGDGSEGQRAEDPMAPIRETLRRDYREGTTVPAATSSLVESWSDLRARLALPWAEGKRERARAREAELLEQYGKEGVPGVVAGTPGGRP